MLLIGLALWIAVHWLKSIAPQMRAGLMERMGAKAYRGGAAAALLLSLVLIIFGYRAADWTAVYDPPGWGVHANNLMMLIAIYLFGVGGAKGWLATKLRHPMLMGATVWAAAHLLANGDRASVVLFGGMASWALLSMALINRREGPWVPPVAKGRATEIRLIIITLVLFVAITFVHGSLLGVWPFPR